MDQTLKHSKHELSQAAKSIGDFIEYWGFKSIHGRIWALIYLSNTPISTPEIVRTLEISKASASIGINDLIERELITASGKVRNGGVTYVSNENVGEIVRSILKERELNLILKTEAHLKILSSFSKAEMKSNNISKEKLDQLSDLTQASKKMLIKITSSRFKNMATWSSFFKKALSWI